MPGMALCTMPKEQRGILGKHAEPWGMAQRLLLIDQKRDTKQEERR